VSQKKLHLFLEGCSTPKFWARNKSQGCFGILRFSAFQNCPHPWPLAQLKLRYLRLKTPGVTFRMNTLCNCNTKILCLTMTPGVFNLKYLSFCCVGGQKWGQFWKAENLRIPKHPRLLFLAQNLGVLQPSKKRCNFFWDTLYKIQISKLKGFTTFTNS